MTSEQARARGGGGNHSGGRGPRGRVDAEQQDMQSDEDIEPSEMSVDHSEQSGKKEQLRWTDDQLHTLVNFLCQHKESGESFKMATYEAAALHLNQTYPDMPTLKGKQVQGKYSRQRKSVSGHFIPDYHTQLTIKQLKKIMQAIIDYSSLSGRHYDRVRGANIHGSAEATWKLDLLDFPLVCFSSFTVSLL